MKPILILASTKPFTNLDTELADGVIWHDECGLNFKIAESKFDADGQSPYIFDIYLATERGLPITVLRQEKVSNVWSGMPTYAARATQYIEQISAPTDTIKHATRTTEYIGFVYKNPAIAEWFTGLKIIGEKQTDIRLAFREEEHLLTINYKGTKLRLSLIERSEGHVGEKEIKGILHKEIGVKLSKPRNISFLREVSDYLDAVFSLLQNSASVANDLNVKTESGQIYNYFFNKRANTPKHTANCLYFGLPPKESFKKICRIVFKYRDKDIFFPFSYPSNKGGYVEEEFSEYYVAMEALRKHKLTEQLFPNSHFLIKLLETFPKTRKDYIKKANSEILAYEISSLRNKYLHTGYHFKKRELEIRKNEKGPLIKTVTINSEWIINRTYLLKALLFEYFFYVAKIDTRNCVRNRIRN